MEKKCCICGKEFIDFSNSAEPIKKGVCCNDCNTKFVIPGRIYITRAEHPVSFEIVKSPKERVSLIKELESRHFELIGSGGSNLLYKNIETEEEVVIFLA